MLLSLQINQRSIRIAQKKQKKTPTCISYWPGCDRKLQERLIYFFSLLPVGHFFLISLIAGSLSIKDGRSIGLIQRIAGRQSTIDSPAGADPYLPQLFGSLFNIRSSTVDMVFNPVNLLLLRLDAKEL